MNIPQNLTNTQLVKWAITNILGDPSKLGTYFEAKMLKHLNYGGCNANAFSVICDDLSAFSRPTMIPFGQNEVVNLCINLLAKRNEWEQKRCQTN